MNFEIGKTYPVLDNNKRKGKIIILAVVDIDNEQIWACKIVTELYEGVGEVQTDGSVFGVRYNHLVATVNAPHVHADKMERYAQDAKITSEPWLLWEYSGLEGQTRFWHKLYSHPGWFTNVEYRRIPT